MRLCECVTWLHHKLGVDAYDRCGESVVVGYMVVFYEYLHWSRYNMRSCFRPATWARSTVDFCSKFDDTGVAGLVVVPFLVNVYCDFLLAAGVFGLGLNSLLTFLLTTSACVRTCMHADNSGHLTCM